MTTPVVDLTNIDDEDTTSDLSSDDEEEKAARERMLAAGGAAAEKRFERGGVASGESNDDDVELSSDDEHEKAARATMLAAGAAAAEQKQKVQGCEAGFSLRQPSASAQPAREAEQAVVSGLKWLAQPPGEFKVVLNAPGGWANTVARKRAAAAGGSSAPVAAATSKGGWAATVDRKRREKEEATAQAALRSHAQQPDETGSCCSDWLNWLTAPLDVCIGILKLLLLAAVLIAAGSFALRLYRAIAID